MQDARFSSDGGIDKSIKLSRQARRRRDELGWGVDKGVLISPGQTEHY
jgi:hypothetical protein